jgi:hypothetical protein
MLCCVLGMPGRLEQGKAAGGLGAAFDGLPACGTRCQLPGGSDGGCAGWVPCSIAEAVQQLRER